VGSLLLACRLASGEAAPEPAPLVTLCELESSPEHFNGKVVRVRGRVIAGPESEVVHQEGCGDGLWLAKDGPTRHEQLEAGAHVAAGSRITELARAHLDGQLKAYLDSQTWVPVPTVAPLTPARDSTWESYLGGAQPGEALLEGRFEHVLPGEVIRHVDGQIGGQSQGFGHLNAWRSQFVLGRVISFADEQP